MRGASVQISVLLIFKDVWVLAMSVVQPDGPAVLKPKRVLVNVRWENFWDLMVQWGEDSVGCSWWRNALGTCPLLPAAASPTDTCRLGRGMPCFIGKTDKLGKLSARKVSQSFIPSWTKRYWLQKLNGKVRSFKAKNMFHNRGTKWKRSLK